MKIEGTHTFVASRVLVWSLLHDPEIIRQAIPGCDQFDQVSPSEFTGQLHIQEGPFAGEYQGSIQLTDGVFQESFTLGLRGEGPEGLIWGDGRITLAEDEGHTTLHYLGELVVSGQTVTSSPRLLRTTANALIRQFFDGLERYIKIQTGIYTTDITGPALRNRRFGTIDMQDKIEEIRQDRRTTLFVFILLTIASLMTIGAVAISFVIVRWGSRLFKQYVYQVVQAQQQNTNQENQAG